MYNFDAFQEEIQICRITVDPLKLQSAKLHKDPGKCAQKMLGSLFTTTELVNGNYPFRVNKFKR